MTISIMKTNILVLMKMGHLSNIKILVLIFTRRNARLSICFPQMINQNSSRDPKIRLVRQTLNWKILKSSVEP